MILFQSTSTYFTLIWAGKVLHPILKTEMWLHVESYWISVLNKLLFNKTCSSIDWTDRQIFYFISIFNFDFVFRKFPLLENKKLHFTTNEFDKKGYFCFPLFIFFLLPKVMFGWVAVWKRRKQGVHNGRKTLEACGT